MLSQSSKCPSLWTTGLVEVSLKMLACSPEGFFNTWITATWVVENLQTCC